jgi:hypothetical protein
MPAGLPGRALGPAHAHAPPPAGGAAVPAGASLLQCIMRFPGRGCGASACKALAPPAPPCGLQGLPSGAQRTTVGSTGHLAPTAILKRLVVASIILWE